MALKVTKPTEDNAVYEFMIKKESEGKVKKWLSPRSLREFNFKYSKRHRTNIGSILYFSY